MPRVWKDLSWYIIVIPYISISGNIGSYAENVCSRRRSVFQRPRYGPHWEHTPAPDRFRCSPYKQHRFFLLLVRFPNHHRIELPGNLRTHPYWWFRLELWWSQPFECPAPWANNTNHTHLCRVAACFRSIWFAHRQSSSDYWTRSLDFHQESHF